MPSLSDYLSGVITNAANAYGVPASIATSLAYQESKYDPNIVSPANNNGTHDYGLFQLNDSSFPNAPNMSVQDNANTAMGYLSQLFAKFGNWYDALRAYNSGPTGATNNPTASSGYAQSILDRAGIGATVPGVAPDISTAGIQSAAATGAQISPTTYPTIQFGGSTSDPTTGTPAQTTTDPAQQSGFVGAINNVASSITDIPSKIGVSISNAENNIVTGIKNWAATSGISIGTILLGGTIFTLVLLSTINSGDNSASPAPKVIPVPI